MLRLYKDGGALMKTEAINIADKFAQFSDLWSPKVIAKMNDYHFKLARIKGEFTWHSHQYTDEVFIVMEGKMMIHFRDGRIELKEGEMFVVPQGIEHKPVAEEECQIMLIEPAGTINTGDAGGEMTAQDEVWL
jgi:mannose-6-phosphate isomerase-like protein (cupin superfamily)